MLGAGNLPRSTASHIGGGCELALCCDFIYAARHARFALPEVTRGIMPGAGATQNLPRAVGVRRAKEIIMSGLPFSADQAQQWGMVNEVCEPAELMPKVMSLAKTICDNAPISVRQIKKAINVSTQTDLTTGLAFEIQCLRTHDLDRRPPRGRSRLQRKAQAAIQGTITASDECGGSTLG